MCSGQGNSTCIVQWVGIFFINVVHVEIGMQTVYKFLEERGGNIHNFYNETSIIIIS